MILDIDIGNTRLKWRLCHAGSTLGRDVCLRENRSSDRVFSSILASIEPLLTTALESIRVSSVAGADAVVVCRQWAESHFGLLPELARVCNGAGGLSCGYAEPDKLGVDRWLAVLAAWQHLGKTCVVVDAGTALTVDVVKANDASEEQTIQATHLGGYIVPGLDMMTDALYSRTDGVRPGPAKLHDLQPGSDTSSAVQRGTLAMMSALVERVRTQTALQVSLNKPVENPVPVVLTGGDAGTLQPFLVQPLYHFPDLVLDGLAIALPSASRR